MGSVTVEQVVDKIYALRERRAALDKQAKEIKEVESRLEGWLLGRLTENNLASMAVNAAVGKVSVFTREDFKASIADMNEVFRFAVAHQAPDIFQHRVSSSTVKEFEERGLDIPGLNIYRERVVSLRKL